MNESIFKNYIEKLQDILERIKQEQGEAIRDAARIVCGSIVKGGIVHVFGAGHSHMMAEEAFFRAGGIAAVNPILDQRLAFFNGAMESTRAEREPGYARTLISREDIVPEDAAILISNSGRNWVPVEMAIELKSRKVSIIAITNVRQSSDSASLHSSGKRLFELADVVVDTCGVTGDAMISIPGLAYPMGPSSTVAGAAIINSIMMEAAATALRSGQSLPVFPSANLPTTGAQTIADLVGIYSRRVRYLDA
jgi:uncharacterized phosphosugar-binding protein